MHRALRALLGVIILLLALSILIFILENQQLVALNFLGWATPQFPVSLSIIFSLLIGLLVGILLRVGGRRRQG
jgi:uncharacterized integral membrane protein